MYIESLKLYHFRNLGDQVVQFNPGANFIVGQNGQGKTNLVEAINLLSLGRSFRTSSLDELVGWQHKDCSVFAKVASNSGQMEIGISIDGDSRKSYLDGNRVEFLGAFLGKLLCISFSPTDLVLVKGSPQERRKFIDKHMVDVEPGMATALVDYSRALRSKNALLKGGVTDQHVLEPWNSLIAGHAVAIHLGREKIIAELKERAARIYKEFCNQDGELDIALKSNAFGAELEPTVENLLERLRASQTREIMQRKSLIGPHRDELEIELGGQSARAFASQGQSRSIVLALKLAVLEILELRRGEAPIILLDDVESELDSSRREALVKLIFERRRQTFVTGTESPRASFGPGHDFQELRLERGLVISDSEGRVSELKLAAN